MLSVLLKMKILKQLSWDGYLYKTVTKKLWIDDLILHGIALIVCVFVMLSKLTMVFNIRASFIKQYRFVES